MDALLESPVPAMAAGPDAGGPAGGAADGKEADAGFVLGEVCHYHHEYDVVPSRARPRVDNIDYNIQRFLKSYEARAAAAPGPEDGGALDAPGGGAAGAAGEDDEDLLYNAVKLLGGAAEEYWARLVSSTRGVAGAVGRACSAQVLLLPSTISAIASRLMTRVAYCTYNVKKRLDLSDTSLVAAGLAGAVVGTRRPAPVPRLRRPRCASASR